MGKNVLRDILNELVKKYFIHDHDYMRMAVEILNDAHDVS